VSAVVSDTSPLRYTIECGVADVLRTLFEEIVIPPAVFDELQHRHTPAAVRAWIEKRPAWIKVQSPTRIDHTLNVDLGEREAISLAKEIGAVVLLMDDRRGRIEAARCGLRVTGTIGLLEAAAERGLLNFRTSIDRLRNTNARLDEELIAAALGRQRQR
jgi:predicted nucleic acid-binding protein